MPSANQNHRLSFPQRILFLALLFGAELAVITVWLDGDSLARAGGLTGAVRDWGQLILRSIVGFAVLFLAIAYLKNQSALEKISKRVAALPVRWSLVAAHLGAMAVFAVLSAGLYGHRMPGSPPDSLAAGWLAAGIAGIVFAGLAVMPWRQWTELMRRTDFAWAYASAAVVLAASAQNASRALWQPAARLTFRLVKLVLQPFVTVVMADPAAMRIQTTHFRIIIAPECSGLEGAGLMLAFGITLLWLFRDECRFPQYHEGHD